MIAYRRYSADCTCAARTIVFSNRETSLERNGGLGEVLPGWIPRLS